VAKFKERAVEISLFLAKDACFDVKLERGCLLKSKFGDLVSPHYGNNGLKVLLILIERLTKPRAMS
jgi:hypothetical protein